MSETILGDVAQLGERLVRNEEVGGSIPLISKSLFPFTGRVVLDGESAVPCSPQSAIAGSNSLPRSFPGRVLGEVRSVEGQVPRNEGLPNPVRTGR